MSQATNDDEVYALDLDWDLLQHLAIPESVARLKAENVSVELIEDDYVVQVFEWQFAHYREHGQPASASVLENEFDDLAIEPPLAVIDDLIGRLRTRYVRNNGEAALENLIERYRTDPSSLAEALYEKGRELLVHTQKRGEYYGTGDYDRAMNEYDQTVLQGPGPTLGYEDLDNHFHGQRGLTFMIGAPKSYKSWFTVNAVVENIIAGRCVTLLSLELPALEAYNRVLYSCANVPWWKYIRGAVLPEDRKKLKEAAEILDGCGVLHVLKPEPGERQVDHMIGRAMDLGADTIYLDQLQYVETPGGRSIGELNDTGDYWAACLRLRDLSDEVPIWIVHQFNRSVMFADELPSMQQIKGSSAIEETATLALGLWANKDMRASNILGMGTLASRNFEWLSWEFKVSLNRECNFELIGRVDD